MCGWCIDDPDVHRFKETIAFLFSRLTNPHGIKASYFATIICANYEGHDWLWKTYMRRQEPGGNNRFAYWILKTRGNPTLDPDYIETQRAIHSKAWMDKYIEGDTSSYGGLVFSEYDPLYHDGDLSWCVEDHTLRKILVVDLGVTHPSVILSVACDYDSIYFYDEWFKVDVRTADVGYQLVEKLDSSERFEKVVIDPKANARDQQSKVSAMHIFKHDFGIKNIQNAENAVKPGIEFLKGLLTVREDSKNPEKKITHVFVDPVRCPNLVNEFESLPWEETEYSENNELQFKEEARDLDNDSSDCARYGAVYFKKFLRNYIHLQDRIDKMIKERREALYANLPFYQGQKRAIHLERTKTTKELINNRIANRRNRDQILIDGEHYA
jgi:hypothetical protein